MGVKIKRRTVPEHEGNLGGNLIEMGKNFCTYHEVRHRPRTTIRIWEITGMMKIKIK